QASASFQFRARPADRHPSRGGRRPREDAGRLRATTGGHAGLHRSTEGTNAPVMVLRRTGSAYRETRRSITHALRTSRIQFLRNTAIFWVGPKDDKRAAAMLGASTSTAATATT